MIQPPSTFFFPNNKIHFFFIIILFSYNINSIIIFNRKGFLQMGYLVPTFTFFGPLHDAPPDW